MKSSPKSIQSMHFKNTRRKQLQQGFVVNWSTTERHQKYDAFADKHAEYFFSNEYVNWHLVKLSKIMDKESRHSHIESNGINGKPRVKYSDMSYSESLDKIEGEAKAMNMLCLAQRVRKARYSLNFGTFKKGGSSEVVHEEVKLPPLPRSRAVSSFNSPKITVNIKKHKRGLSKGVNSRISHSSFLEMQNKRKKVNIKHSIQNPEVSSTTPMNIMAEICL